MKCSLASGFAKALPDRSPDRLAPPKEGTISALEVITIHIKCFY
jgi:hypothetical protein